MHFRVATYNIRFGGKNRGDLIVKVLKDIDADVILLTEASDNGTLDNIAKSLGMFQVNAKTRKAQLAVLTHKPIVEEINYCPVGLERPLIGTKIAISEERHILLYGLHLQCHYFKRNEVQRIKELKIYLEYIKSKAQDGHLLLGDFNAIAPNDRFRLDMMPLKEKGMIYWEGGHIYRDAISLLLSEGYVDCFRMSHPYEDGFTLPSKDPHVRLDYIFADSVLAKYLQDCEVVKSHLVSLASDHCPVVATFSM
jgi:endonuclease/exonuclease/phosphatase family metal-dependent hydrolase